MKTTLLALNLQQGLFVCTETNEVIGVYSHHSQTIIPKHPLKREALDIPQKMEGYYVIENHADSFSLNVYTSHGTKEFN